MILRPLIGIIAIIACAFFFSTHRAIINYRLVVRALVVQLLCAIFVLKTGVGSAFMQGIARAIAALYAAADAGIRFMFGALADSSGSWGFLFFVKVLPAIIFFGALLNLLFYIGIIAKLVSALERVFRPLLGTSGSETLCAVANSFLGQTEAPLLVRHYLASMSPSELLVVMATGMATMSGAIIAVYGMMGVSVVHMLTASLMAIPGTILIAKIVIPETKKEVERASVTPVSATPVSATPVGNASSALGAITQGVQDGLAIAIQVGAMLVAIVALIALFNSVVGFFFGSLTLQKMLGYALIPLAWLVGLPESELIAGGGLIGSKFIFNEMIAYQELVRSELSPRSVTIVTYALAGFANISSMGIQIGALSALIPERKELVIRVSGYALLVATLSNLLSACVVALLL